MGLVWGTKNSACWGCSTTWFTPGNGRFTTPSPNPASLAASAPAVAPSIRPSARPKVPLQEPTERSCCFDSPGLKLTIFSSQTGLAPVWELKWIAALHPPEVAIRSQATVCTGPTTCVPSVLSAATSADRTRFPPLASMTPLPSKTEIPSALTDATNSPLGALRESTTATTSRPALCQSSAVR